MIDSKWVRVGSIRRFDHVEPDKAQAVKVLEEAAEVVEAWKQWCATTGWAPAAHEDCRRALLDECADVVQAVIDLAAALDVDDLRPYLKECERRNRKRGRITDGRSGRSIC